MMFGTTNIKSLQEVTIQLFRTNHLLYQ